MSKQIQVVRFAEALVPAVEVPHPIKAAFHTVVRIVVLVLAAVALPASLTHASPILYVGDYIQKAVNRYDATNLNVGGTPPALSTNPFIGSNFPISSPPYTTINNRVESIRGYSDKILVAVDGGKINEYDVNTGNYTNRTFQATSNVADMAISSDGSKLYAVIKPAFKSSICWRRQAPQ